MPVEAHSCIALMCLLIEVYMYACMRICNHICIFVNTRCRCDATGYILKIFVCAFTFFHQIHICVYFCVVSHYLCTFTFRFLCLCHFC